MERFTRASLLLAALVALTLTGCGHKPAAKPAGEAKAAPADDTVKVRTGQVAEVIADETIDVTGSIIAGNDVQVASKIPGRIVSLGDRRKPIDEGMRVSAGQAVVLLDSSAAEADLARAKAAVHSAQAMYRKSLLSRTLVETQTQQAIIGARAGLDAAKARQAQAESALRIAETKSGTDARTGTEVQSAENNLRASQLRLTQAKEALAIARSKTTGDVTSADSAVNQASVLVQQSKNRLAQAESGLALTDATTSNAVDSANQGVVQAKNALAILEEGARPQERASSSALVAAANAGVSASRAAQAQAEVDLKRVKALYEGGAIAKSALDNAQLALDTRTEQLRQAEEQLKQAKEQSSLVEVGPRTQQIQISRAQLVQAQQALDLAKSTRQRSLEQRQQDVATAREDVARAEQAQRAATAALATAKAAVGQVPISEADVAAAEQAVATAEQALRLAKAGMGQTDIARSELVAAKQSVATAQTALRNAEAGSVNPEMNRWEAEQLRGALMQAEAAQRAAEVTLKEHRIVAPMDGTIAEKATEAGAVVQPGQKLFRLVNDRAIHFDALVPEEKVRFVTAGDGVDVSVDALPNRKFIGHVIEVLPAADVRSRSFTVKVGVPNAAGTLKQGMFARGSVVVQRNKRTLRVPAGAIVRRDERNYVVRVSDGTSAKPVEIELGSNHEGLVEINGGGLLPGDTIVTEGAAEITGPAKIKVITEKDLAPKAEDTKGGADQGKAKGKGKPKG